MIHYMSNVKVMIIPLIVGLIFYRVVIVKTKSKYATKYDLKMQQVLIHRNLQKTKQMLMN